MAHKKWSFVEIGVLAYVIYSSIGAVIGGVMFVVAGLVMSEMHSGADQEGLDLTGPSLGHVVQAIGGLLLAIGLIAGALSAWYISRHRSSDTATGDSEPEREGGIDTSHLAGAVLGVAAADAAQARRRRRRRFNASRATGRRIDVVDGDAPTT